MNIFYVDRDPTLAAQMLGNAHVRSQIKECMQMMSVAHYLHGLDDDRFLPITHKNHPCTVWVRAFRHNYVWITKHLRALLDEYKYRHGNPHHLSELYPLYEQIPADLPNPYSHTHSVPPAVVSPDLKPNKPISQISHVDVELAYRAYYNRDKRHLHHWMVRKPPAWVLDDVQFAEHQHIQSLINESKGTNTDGKTHPG